MRIAIAHIAQETNTFSPILTDMDLIRANGLYTGDDVLTIFSDWSGIKGFLDVIGDEDLVGIVTAQALPAGCITKETVDEIMEIYIDGLEKALSVDGILLSLHGAHVGSDEPDIEGLILEKTRALVGVDMPIGVSLDLHANITRKMVEHATVIRGFHTHPHLDIFETGREAALMFKRTVLGEVNPVISAVKIPMITPAERQLTDEYPMKDIFDLTSKHEAMDGVLSSNLFAVQPWMDIPEMGWCSLVVTDNDRELADRLARETAQFAWDQRREYITSIPTYTEALDEAFALDEAPVVVSDFADTTNGGGTGDSTWFLKDLLRRNPSESCYLSMVDPEVMHIMEKAGEGAQITVRLGGKQDSEHSEPVEVTGEVIHIIPLEEKRELWENMGVAGVLNVGKIFIVVSERQGRGSESLIYSGARLDPTKAKILLAKSPMDFRAGFKDVGKAFLLGEAPGLAPSNLLSLKWKKIPRPLFPLEDHEWSGAEGTVYRSK